MMARPRVLIGYSTCQTTRVAFETAGCEAWTCDLRAAEGERHLQCDIWDVLRDNWTAAVLHPMCTCLTVSAAWAFNDPDFTRYPGVGYHQKVKSGTLTGQARRDQRELDLENFRKLLALPYPKAIENPARSFINKAIRPPDQCIHPHQFGDDASKATGLWLDRLPSLRPTGNVPPRLVPRPRASSKSDKPHSRDGCNSERLDLFGEGLPRWANQSDTGQNNVSEGDGRWLERSKTYPGIANAMGDQWGRWLIASLR